MSTFASRGVLPAKHFANRLTGRCHHLRKRVIQYSRADDGIETPLRTGYPAGACHRAALRADPLARNDEEIQAASVFSTSLIQYEVPNTIASSLKL